MHSTTYVHEHVYLYNVLGLLESHIKYQDDNADGNWDMTTTTSREYDIEQRLISEVVEIDSDANSNVDAIIHKTWAYDMSQLVEYRETEDSDMDGNWDNIWEQFWEYDLEENPIFAFTYVETSLQQYEEYINYEYVDGSLQTTSTQKDTNIDGIVDFYQTCMWQYSEENIENQNAYWNWSIEICDSFSETGFVSTQIHESQFDETDGFSGIESNSKMQIKRFNRPMKKHGPITLHF